MKRMRSKFSVSRPVAALSCIALACARQPSAGTQVGTAGRFQDWAVLKEATLAGCACCLARLPRLPCIALRGGSKDFAEASSKSADEEGSSRPLKKARAAAGTPAEGRRKLEDYGPREDGGDRRSGGDLIGGAGVTKTSAVRMLDRAETCLEQLRDEMVPLPLEAQLSFAGLFSQSPRVKLPGHGAVTLEHFRAERIAFDERGEFLEENTYRWRDRLVRVVLDETGRNKALEDVATGLVIYAYAERQKVYLRGHADVYIDDFPLERVPREELGVYGWRDRTVRVITAEGKLERIIDTDDGSIVHLFDTSEDQHMGHLNTDLFDPEYHRFDRPASAARLARLCELSSKGAAPFGQVHVVWPNKGAKGTEDIRHGGTVIWLHGVGGGAAIEELARNLTEQLALPWVKYIFPSAPAQPCALLGGAVTTSWFDVTRLDAEGSRESAEGLKRSADFVAQLVQDEIIHGTDPNELIVCGFGQGAVVALDVALRAYTWQPPEEDDKESWDSDDPDAPTTISAVADRQAMIEERRAEKRELLLQAEALGTPLLENPPKAVQIGGVALLSGWFPGCLAGLEPAWAGELKTTYWMGARNGRRGGVETFVAHGETDSTVPLALGKQLFKHARKAGFSVSKLLKFPHGHGLSRREMLELRCWIDRQIPDPDWHITDFIGAESASSQEYTHRGALETGVLPS